MNQKLTLVLIVIVVVVCVILVIAGLRKPASETTSSNSMTGTTASNETPGSLKIEDLTVGSGPEATNGALLTVNYRGTLLNGTQFDSSYDRREPFQFPLGQGQVIPGWDQGLLGMKVGGKRRLTIPAGLAYGSRPVGGIPANSTLVFEVELLGVN